MINTLFHLYIPVPCGLRGSNSCIWFFHSSVLYDKWQLGIFQSLLRLGVASVDWQPSQFCHQFRSFSEHTVYIAVTNSQCTLYLPIIGRKGHIFHSDSGVKTIFIWCARIWSINGQGLASKGKSLVSILSLLSLSSIYILHRPRTLWSPAYVQQGHICQLS